MGIRQHGDIGEFGMKGLHCTVIVISASPNQICKKRQRSPGNKIVFDASESINDSDIVLFEEFGEPLTSTFCFIKTLNLLVFEDTYLFIIGPGLFPFTAKLLIIFPL